MLVLPFGEKLPKSNEELGVSARRFFEFLPSNPNID